MLSTPSQFLAPLGPLTRSGRKALHDRWLARRIPAATDVCLDQRRIFIFPTRAGGLYLVLLAVLLITAINYQNGGIYVLVFMLAGQLAAATLATYVNLAGLRVRRATAVSGYAGEQVTFRVLIRRDAERLHRSLQIGWPQQGMVSADLVQQREWLLELYHHAPRRGLLRPRRLRVETVYPLGLLRAWTWLDLELECWVYPAPVPRPDLPLTERSMTPTQCKVARQHDEFCNFRPWRPQDPPRHVLWKAYAREQPLMTMEFSDQQPQDFWLDEGMLGDASREQRLSVLCFAALQLAERGERFGIRLGSGETLDVSQGDEHLRSVLLLLARQPHSGEETA